MKIPVLDSSVIIDLDRGNLLDCLFDLPYEFCVPDLLHKKELAGKLGDRLQASGLGIVELTPEELSRATSLRRQTKVISTPDAFAFVLAQSRCGTLLTGDRALRDLGVEQGVKIRGLLWVIAELNRIGVTDASALHAALTPIFAHPRSRLPKAKVRNLLASLSGNGS